MARSIKTAEPTVDLSRSRYVARARADGVSVIRPSGLPLAHWLKGAFAAYCLLTFYKAFAVAGIGVAGYQDRVGALMVGTPFEALVLPLLRVDFVTLYLAKGLFPIF